MENNSAQRNVSEDYLILEDSQVLGTLIEIKSSSKYKKEMIDSIKKEIKNQLELDTNYWKNLQNEKLDLAIIIHVTKSRYNFQDVDNIAKIVLDALKKKDSENYLINDDSQIIRLLVYKKLLISQKNSRTSQLSISIRKHDPKKEMTIKKSGSILTKKEYLAKQERIK